MSTSAFASASASSAPPRRRFIDIGANLTDGMFRGEYHGKTYHDPDLDVVLRRGWDVGVEKIIVTAGTLSEARDAIRLANDMDPPGDDRDDRDDRRLFTTVGVHPTRCGEFAASGDPEGYLRDLGEVLATDAATRGGRVVAIGECGLDYDRLQFCDEETQKVWFERQFELAEASGLPMFLHMRAAGDDFVAAMERNASRFRGGVVHSFTGTADEARRLLAIDGVYIGINGCSLRTEESLEVVKTIPADRIMLETDAPWCGVKKSHPGSGWIETTWPAKDKKKRAGVDTGETVKDRCEPCHIAQVAEVLAAAKGMDERELARACYENAAELFFGERRTRRETGRDDEP